MQRSPKQSSGLRAWLAQRTTRTHPEIAIVAFANALARMARVRQLGSISAYSYGKGGGLESKC
jgi:hypothetical protein